MMSAEHFLSSSIVYNVGHTPQETNETSKETYDTSKETYKTSQENKCV